MKLQQVRARFANSADPLSTFTVFIHMDLGGIDMRNIWCVGVLMSDNTCMHSFPALHVHIAELLYFSGLCNSVQPEVESVRKTKQKTKQAKNKTAC